MFNNWMKKEVRKVENKVFNKTGIILFGIFLLIGIAFFVSLSMVKSGVGSGTGGVVNAGPFSVNLSPTNSEFDLKLGEIIFAIVFAFLMSGFLLWTKSMISKNAYLGTIIGLIGAGIMGYAFSLRYRGFYSTIFMVATGAVVLVYLGMSFYKYKNVDEEEEEGEEEQ